MECENCKTEIDAKSNFCGKCGKKPKGKSFDLDSAMRTHRDFWFMAGLHRGFCLRDKDNEGIKAFESILKEFELYDEYRGAVDFWGDKLNELNLNLKNGIKSN